MIEPLRFSYYTPPIVEFLNAEIIMKTILCYGDSNTWGFIPCAENYRSLSTKRYPRDVRWPGRLQQLLGSQFHVIEEGLNSRTTNLDYQVPPDRNGATYLPPCLYSHAPIDLVILALGGNDLKSYFGRTPADVCNGMRALIDIIQNSQYGSEMQSAPDILLLSQPIPLPIAEEYVDEAGNHVFENLVARAQALVPLYQMLARDKQCHFLDLSDDVKPSAFDGAHLDKSAHIACADLVHQTVLTIFS